jgi:hypothetical protein
MSAITPSIAGFLSARLDALAIGGAKADVAGDIPPAMLRHLRNQGIAYIFAWPVWTVGGMTSLGALFDWLGWFPMDLSVTSVAINFGTQTLGAFVLAPFLLRAPLKRELRYRRQHGNWRWER